MLTIDSTVWLSSGVEMPRFGLGTYKSQPGDEVEHAVAVALSHGYRLVDTASLYDNEPGVGTALRASGLPREGVFVTTKVWNDDQGYEGTLRALDLSLAKLQTDYVDLYLVHWPMRSHLKGTWRAMEAALSSGTTRAIGVCNFAQPHLEELIGIASVPPALNQFEFHPWLQQPGLQAYMAETGIALQGWASLMRGRVAELPELIAIAEAHGKSPAQIAIRWVLQKGHCVIPKSVHEERIVSNAQVFDFDLTVSEMATIDGLDRGFRLGKDPQEYVW